MQITSKCLPAILKLQYLEELILEGCFAIDDDGLAAFKLGSQSLKVLSLARFIRPMEVLCNSLYFLSSFGFILVSFKNSVWSVCFKNHLPVP